MNQAQRKRAEDFISRLELVEDVDYTKRETQSSAYRLYALRPNGTRKMFGSVRLNVGGQDPGKLNVYAMKGFYDPEERFTCQDSNPKDCYYKFWPDDEEAMEYAVCAVKSAYGNKVR